MDAVLALRENEVPAAAQNIVPNHAQATSSMATQGFGEFLLPAQPQPDELRPDPSSLASFIANPIDLAPPSPSEQASYPRPIQSHSLAIASYSSFGPHQPSQSSSGMIRRIISRTAPPKVSSLGYVRPYRHLRQPLAVH